MENRNMVMVCMDKEYLLSIEGAMAEALGYTYELTVISDLEYNHQFWENPHDIDILIVEEKLLSEFILKQNPKKILILTEREKTLHTKEISYQYIYKYAGIRRLLEMIDASLLVNDDAEACSFTKQVNILAPAGGCGKTSIALGIAKTLAQDGNKVLYYSMETLQDYAVYLGTQTYLSEKIEVQLNLALEDGVDLLLQSVEHNEFDYFPPYQNISAASKITPKLHGEIIEMIKQKNKYDYIVVDLCKEFHLEMFSILNNGDSWVIVTGDELHHRKKLDIFLSGISKVKKDCVIVCNMNTICPYEELNGEITKKNIPIIYMKKYTEHYIWDNPQGMVELRKISYSIK